MFRSSTKTLEGHGSGLKYRLSDTVEYTGQAYLHEKPR